MIVWDDEIMEKLLDEYEKEQPLDNHTWEKIQEIKTALWIGYKFKNQLPCLDK